MNDFDYINKYYGLNCKVNQVILFNTEEKMVITGSTGHYLICWDYSTNRHVTVHPTWNVIYTEEFDIPKISKSKIRYQEYLRSDCGVKFGEWLKMSK